MCFAIDLPEAKQQLKRSIGKMMVYWVVHSRHTLRDELLNNNPNNRWADLDFKNAFASSPEEAKLEFERFFSKARDLFKEKNDHEGSMFIKVPGFLKDSPLIQELLGAGAEQVEVVTAGAKRINERVDGLDGDDGDWCDVLYDECPPNRVLNVMFNAAMAFVDNTDWEAMPAVAKAIAEQAATIS